MEEQCNTATTAPIKEATKFENLASEIDRLNGCITPIINTISNIEDRLGESKDQCASDCEKREEPSSIIEKNTMKVRDVNDDLISIQSRLSNIQNLF